MSTNAANVLDGVILLGAILVLMLPRIIRAYRGDD